MMLEVFEEGKSGSCKTSRNRGSEVPLSHSCHILQVIVSHKDRADSNGGKIDSTSLLEDLRRFCIIYNLPTQTEKV